MWHCQVNGFQIKKRSSFLLPFQFDGTFNFMHRLCCSRCPSKHGGRWCAMLIVLRGNLTSKVGGTLVISFESHFHHYDLMELAWFITNQWSTRWRRLACVYVSAQNRITDGIFALVSVSALLSVRRKASLCIWPSLPS